MLAIDFSHFNFSATLWIIFSRQFNVFLLVSNNFDRKAVFRMFELFSVQKVLRVSFHNEQMTYINYQLFQAPQCGVHTQYFVIPRWNKHLRNRWNRGRLSLLSCESIIQIRWGWRENDKLRNWRKISFSVLILYFSLMGK